MRSASWLMLVAVAANASACAGDDADGSNEPAWAYSGSQLSDYAANWNGYAEAWQFESGSDRIRVVLNASGQGTIEFGDAPLLPPPTDPNVGYPPGASDGEFRPGVTEGFLYPIYNAHVEGLRIRFGADPNDLFRDWCQMQTPVLDEVNTGPLYACLPNWPFGASEAGCYMVDPGTNEQVPVDCGKLALCLFGPCECTASACDVPAPAGAYPIQFDGALESDGNHLVGTVVLDGQTRVTVRLTRG